MLGEFAMKQIGNFDRHIVHCFHAQHNLKILRHAARGCLQTGNQHLRQSRIGERLHAAHNTRYLIARKHQDRARSIHRRDAADERIALAALRAAFGGVILA